jgi:hypothetical protein
LLTRAANRLIFSRAGRWAGRVLWPAIALWAGRLRWAYAIALLVAAVVLVALQVCRHGLADTPGPPG